MNAERALLGACLIDPDAFVRVRTLVGRGDFSTPAAHSLWGVFDALADRGDPTDLVLVWGEIERQDLVSVVGGTAALCILPNYTPSSLHAEHYAREVARRARARRGETERQPDLAELMGLTDEHDDDGPAW